jgi:hypothetical protein
VSTVDSVGVTAPWPSIAFDSQGDLHVSYYDAAQGAIRYAKRSAQSWQKQTVALIGVAGPGYNDLALDSSGKAHLVFYDPTNKRLRYAKQQ